MRRLTLPLMLLAFTACQPAPVALAWEVFDFDRGLSLMHDAPEMVWTGAGTRTVVLTPDIVWTLREGNSTAIDTTGAVVGEGQFIETAVWVKRDGERKIMLGHDNDATSPE